MEEALTHSEGAGSYTFDGVYVVHEKFCEYRSGLIDVYHLKASRFPLVNVN